MGAMMVGACCFGASAIMYMLSCSTKSEARFLDSAIRVRRLEELGDLLGDNNTSSLLVALSGKVGSTSAFKCNRSGVMGVSVTEKAKLVFRTKIEAADKKLKEKESEEIQHSRKFLTKNEDKWKEESEENILSQKTVPWFLEDETGRVNAGFVRSLKTYVFDEPVNELFQRVLKRRGVEIVSHTCSEEVLEIGTPFNVVAEAFRDNDGAPTIRGPYKFLDIDTNVDQVVHNLELDSKSYGDSSLFYTAAGVVLVGVAVLLECLNIKQVKDSDD